MLIRLPSLLPGAEARGRGQGWWEKTGGFVIYPLAALWASKLARCGSHHWLVGL